ncbi:sclerostin isoform X1 [Scleropages formosus]|nr:dual specificity protein phosphatase 3 isoform X1 [Scleropages formosus]
MCLVEERTRHITMLWWSTSTFILILLLQGCWSQGWKVFRNDATEIIPEDSEDQKVPFEEPQLSNNTMNRPGHVRRRVQETPLLDASELSCQELRSTRYITDGSCRSTKPVKELMCSGQCVTSHLLPNSILRAKWWKTSTSDYRCVPAHIRTQRVQLHCPHGHRRTYKVRAVTSCKCKRYSNLHNQSEAKDIPAGLRPRRNKKRTLLLPQGRGSNRRMTGNAY